MSLSWESDLEPHVLWGAVAIVGMALLLLFYRKAGKYSDLLTVLIALFAAGIAVDVTAHGYQH